MPDLSAYGFFDPSQMGGYDPYAAYGASPYQAQTKSGQDAIARLLLQNQLDQQNAIAKQQYDQMKSQQDASLQSQRLMAEQQQREGPYSGLARQLSSYGQQMVQTDPMFQAGQFLPKAAGEMFGQDSNPWVKTIATALAGGFGQAMSRSAYQNTMDNEVKPLYQKLFELSRDPQGGQKMLEDPRLAQFASPFVLQQLNDQALQNKTRIEAGGKWMDRGIGMTVGQDGSVSANGIPGWAQTNALTQGLQKRAEADAQNMSDQQFDPMTKGLEKRAELAAQGLGMPTGAPLPKAGPPDQFNFGGGQSLNDQFDQRFQELRQQGLPPTQAAQTARAELDGARKNLAGTFKEASAAREKAQRLSELAQTAEAGVSGAGETGGFGWGARNALSSMYATISPEENNQRTAQALLDSIGPEIVKMSRSSGAVSDFETKLYIGAGPNSQNTPEANRMLIEKLRTLSQIEGDHADFLDAFRDQQGSMKGAGAMWQKYVRAYPLFTTQADGSIVANTNRPSWQDFFSGGAQPMGNIAGPVPVNTGPGVRYPERGTPDQPSAQGPMVTIRNKRTGEMMQVPASMLGGG